MSDDFLTPSKVAAELRERGLTTDKRFGQNFLIDRAILSKIVRAAALSEQDLVVEVGTGLGALTRELARSGASVLSIELDKRLEPYLVSEFTRMPNVKIVIGDALTVDLTTDLTADLSGEGKAADRGGLPNKLVANLPYNVATPLFTRALEQFPSITDMFFLVQKEVAQRITAKPGSKEYGYYTVRTGLFGEGKVLFTVAPGSFFPPPKVTSSFVHFKRSPSPLVDGDQLAKVLSVVEAAFSNRRKKALNSLQINLVGMSNNKNDLENAFSKAGISPEVRAEDISIPEFIELTKHLSHGGQTDH